MLYPRNELEEKIFKDPEIQKGLKYGKPRRGHPEGSVKNHIIEIFKKIELRKDPPKVKEDLRIIASIHDSLKFKVDYREPRVGDNNHGVLARKFAEKYISDPVILDIIELHDTYYYMWIRLNRKGENIDDDFNKLVSRIKDGLELYIKFMFIDGTTGDKDFEPRRWFYEKILKSGHLERSKPAQS